MKKTILALAVLALAFTGCNKEETTKSGETFSKASVVVNVTNAAKTGAVTGDFWDYVTFNVTAEDFNGGKVTATLNASKSSIEMTTTTKPTADKSQFAKVKVTPVLSDNIPEKMNVDYNVCVSGIIYDAKGNVLRETTPGNINAKGECKGTQFKSTFKKDVASSIFELCYVENALSGEWMYNYGITTW